MSKSFNFITSNKGKVSTLQNKLGADFVVNQINLELIEPQADSVEEIVKIKANEAYEQVNKTLIVHDTGFIIPALNNFPGPYIKYINSTIGIVGILKLLEGVEDRTCYFVGSVCFQDENGQKVFNNQSGNCEIAREIRGELPATAWSPLWQIVVPNWSEGKTFAEIGQEGMKEREQRFKSRSEMDQLVEFLTK